ncbi:MAG TPA: hypothetical protein VGX03_30770 [Candidatus Binatia bacterium]|jgi:amidase|nr:hypothetical protein [Candidatus Binatia bacterium]
MAMPTVRMPGPIHHSGVSFRRGVTPAGLPVGMQIVGPYLEDRTPIDFARRLAEVVGGFEAPPGY